VSPDEEAEYMLLLATIKLAIEAHDIEHETAADLRGLIERIYRDVCRFCEIETAE
jgi:hypothetical protein